MYEYENTRQCKHKGTKQMKLTFYMKSGNVIIQDNVEKYEFEYSGNDITSISLDTIKNENRMLIGTLNLSQIECVVREDDPVDL